MPSASIRTAAYARLGRGERDQRAQERRVLGDDHVAGVDHQLRGQVEALLAALDDQHVVGGARHAVPGEPLGDLGPQLRQAVRGRVLQGGGVLGREQVARTPRAAPSTGNSAGSG